MDELNKHNKNLSEITLFSELNDEQLSDIAAICKLKNYFKNDILFKEGDFYLGFFILLKGSVKVFKITSKGSETVVHIIKPTTAFADIPLFDGTDYPINAQCLEDCLVVFIPKDKFLKLIINNPTISLKCYQDLQKD